MNEKIFNESRLDEEEQWYEDHFDEFVPSQNQEELRKQLMSAAKRNVEKRKSKITINIENTAISYFKKLAEDTGISYQNLINLYLVQCAKENKKPIFA